MAVLYASKSGNIDAADMWATTKGGATFKTLAEINTDGTYILAANSYTITVNQSVTATRCSTAVEGTDSTASGGFVIGDTAVTITADGQAGGTSCFTTNGTAAITLNGTAYGSETTNNCRGVSQTTAIRLTITRAIGGSNATSGTRPGIYATAGTINITNIASHATGGSPGLLADASAVIINISGVLTFTPTTAPIVYSRNCTVSFNFGATGGFVVPKTSGGAGTYKLAKTILAGNVLEGVNGDGSTAPATGTYHAPEAYEVVSGAVFGPLSAIPGNVTNPLEVFVQNGIDYGAYGTQYHGALPLPTEAQVLKNISYGPGSGLTGQLEPGGGALVGPSALISG